MKLSSLRYRHLQVRENFLKHLIILVNFIMKHSKQNLFFGPVFAYYKGRDQQGGDL